MPTRISVTQGVMDITVSLTAMDCPGCSVVFAIPDRLNKERREDGKSFYCPNGHSMVYGGEIDKLRTALSKAEADRAWYEKRTQQAIDDEAAARRSLSATRGQVTKLR